MTRYEELTPRRRRQVDFVLNTLTVLLTVALIVGLVLAAQTDLRP